MPIAIDDDDTGYPMGPTGLPDLLDTGARIWRFSGLCADGIVIAFEFAGPSGETDTLVFRPTMVLGRDTERCDVVVPDRTVSRVHAQLRFFIEGGLMIKDLNSANGTFVDGERIGSDFSC